MGLKMTLQRTTGGLARNAEVISVIVWHRNPETETDNLNLWVGKVGHWLGGGVLVQRVKHPSITC